MRIRPWWRLGLVGALTAALAGCGGGGDAVPEPSAALGIVPGTMVDGNTQAPGSTLAFTAQGVPVDAVQYQWRFGDGSASTQAAPSHSFAAPGDYSVDLQVTRSDGRVLSASTVVAVRDLGGVRDKLCSGGGAQGWCWQRPLPQGNGILAYGFADAANGWAVGEAGTILRTTDGGASWRRQVSPSTQDLRHVAVVSSQVAWAAAANGELLLTEDGGASWQARAIASGGGISALGARSARQAWVNAGYGNPGSFTIDGGASWQVRAGPTGVNGNIYTATDGSLWVLPTYQNSGSVQLARSNDHGVSWRQTDLPDIAAGQSYRTNDRFQAWSDQTALLTTTGYGIDPVTLAYTYQQQRWRTLDGGSSWQSVGALPNGPSDGYAYAAQVSLAGDGGRLLAWTNASDSAQLYRSDDAGASWTAVSLPSAMVGDTYGGWVSSLQAFDAQRWLMTDGRGRLWLSHDAGTRWTALLPSGSDGSSLPALNSVWFFDRLEGLALANDGSSLRTSDGGRSWATTAPLASASWRGMKFLRGSDTGWLMGGASPYSSASTVLRSTDRGRTWMVPAPQTSATMVGLSDFHFTDAQHGFACASGYNYAGDGQAKLYRSDDGGQSWQAVAGSTHYGALNSIAFGADGLHGVAVGTSVALVTADGGTTWTPRATGAATTLNRVAFVDAHTVVAVGGAGQIFYSPDQGQTWRRAASAGDARLTQIFVVSPQLAVAVGDGGTVLRSTDAGRSWQAQPSGTRRALADVFFIDAYNGWAVGDSGSVLATGTGGQ